MFRGAPVAIVSVLLLYLASSASAAPVAGVGNSLEFSTDDYILIPNSPSLSLSGADSFTIAMWIRSGGGQGTLYRMDAGYGEPQTDVDNGLLPATTRSFVLDTGTVGNTNYMAIAANAPSFFKPSSVETLVDVCAGISEAAPGLPFYYYHIPALTGVNFPMVDFLRAAGKRMPALMTPRLSPTARASTLVATERMRRGTPLVWSGRQAFSSSLRPKDS